MDDNVTLVLEGTELSASERTRRLIPYMAFYVPVQELPINQQYASIQTVRLRFPIILRPQTPTKTIHSHSQTKHGARPSATGASGGSHIPLPPQYVHMKSPGTVGASYLQSPPAAAHYQPSAGDVYHTLTYGGQHHFTQQHPQHPQPQPQYQQLPTPLKPIENGANHKYPGHRLLSAGPPGPSAPSAVNLANGKINPNRVSFEPKQETTKTIHINFSQ